MKVGFRIEENKKETEMKSVRFPVDLLEQIEKELISKDISFSTYVIQACRYALKHKVN